MNGHAVAAPAGAYREDEGLTLRDLGAAWRRDRWLIVLGTIAAGALGYGATYLIAPTFTASTTFMPPQQQQNAAASALASLGSLASLAGGGGGALKTPGDQYVSLLQSATASDRIIDRFKLMDAYQATLRVDARRSLAERVRIGLGKKDGLITVEVDDTVPARAAQIANQYVEELRQLTSSLAVTEAQQRRVFFEQQLAKTRDQLAAAQQALQRSGFDPGALKAEPRASADAYIRLKAEAAAAETRLRALRNSLADGTPEVTQQATVLASLRERLAQAERSSSSEPAAGGDYVGKYREFKYQEALFEVYARQFELARVDESREGALIQVIDPATPPERKSKPRRGTTAIGAAWGGAMLLLSISVARQLRRRSRERAVTMATAASPAT